VFDMVTRFTSCVDVEWCKGREEELRALCCFLLFWPCLAVQALYSRTEEEQPQHEREV